MTDQQHPITPPPELVVEWADTIYQQTECGDQRDLYVATQAARWGADQELEACCAWLVANDWKAVHQHLRAARRPKPPSLKELALAKLPEQPENMASHLKLTPGDVYTIRRALEQLND